MAQKTGSRVTPEGNTAKPTRLPKNVHARAAALATAIRVRKARGATVEGTKHTGRTPAAMLVKA